VFTDPTQYDTEINAARGFSKPSVTTSVAPVKQAMEQFFPRVTEQEVLEAQNLWAQSIVEISKSFLMGGDYVSLAGERAGELYGYDHSNVLFKPTKASEQKFRPTANDAMSYFVGHDAVISGYKEDQGFAINAKKGFLRSTSIITRSTVTVTWHTPWVPMSSRVPPPVRFQKSSTPSDTSVTTMERCASVYTIPPSRTSRVIRRLT